MNKKFTSLLLLIIIGLILYFFDIELPQKTPPQAEPAPPKTKAVGVKSNFDYLPTGSASSQLVEHEHYSLSYREEYEQAEWVAYELTKAEVLNKVVQRSDRFKPDKLVQTQSATTKDYARSGYDRGHLLPAADISFSKEAMESSFLMSNISPQNPSFNRGIWKKLEEQVREWAVENETLYIITAGILEPGLPTIGTENKVAVPRYFYKIILDYHLPDLKAIAFLFPNEGSKKSLPNYVVSIDSLENLTGLNFFRDLPDDQEATLESQKNWAAWEN